MMNGIEIRICPMIDRPWRLVEPPLFPRPLILVRSEAELKDFKKALAWENKRRENIQMLRDGLEG